MAVAWIGFAGGVLAAVVSALVAVRQSRMDERLARLNRQLDAEVRAEEVLTRYRQPLAAAAFDLQARLHNVLRLGFVETFGGDHPLGREAARTTLFRFAQYFGWSEIVRRDVQFLSFADDDESREVARLQARISEHFLDSGTGHAMMIWRDEQRAIGERMIVEEHGTVLCMGYARFSDCCDTLFGPWLERLWRELPEPSAHARLRNVQHALLDLVEQLDARKVLQRGPLERS
jgi:hypothetical protein